MIRLTKRLVVKLWQGLLLAVILIGILSGVARLLAPVVAGYRGEVAQWAQETLGQPVRIGDMAARWRGFGPRLVLHDVALLDARTRRPNLQFSEVRIDLNLIDVLRSGNPVPQRVTVVGAELLVKRRSDGSIVVQGLEDLQAQGDGGGASPLYLLPWRLAFRDSTVFWENQAIGAEPVRFENVAVTLVNDGPRHQLDASLNLPGKDRGRMELHADLRGALDRPGAWVGDVYLKGGRLALGELLEGRLPEGYVFERGRGDMELWSRWEGGRMRRLQGRIGWKDLRLSAGGRTGREDARVLEVERLGARFLWEKQVRGWRFGMEEIDLRRAGRSWPGGGLSLAVRYDDQNRLRLEAGIEFLRLEDLQAVLDLFPPPPGPAAEALAGLRPRGDLRGIQIGYTETADAPRWSFSGRMEHLHTIPWGDIPGMKNITARVEIDQDRGAVLLDSRRAGLDFPGLFRAPLELERLAGLAQWVRMPDGGWRIRADDLAARNQDIRTRTRIRLDLPGPSGPSPFLDLQTDFEKGAVSSAHRYLPVGIMDKGLVDWLDRALAGGRVTSGSCLVRGRLGDFPYENHAGRFEVLFGVEELVLDYYPGWPRVEEVAAEIRFLDNGFDAWITEGRILASHIRRAHGRIDRLSEGSPFELEGETRGPLGDHLRLLRETPLSEDFAATVANMRAEGEARLAVDFAIPLADDGLPPFRIHGRVDFQNSTLHLEDWQLSLEAMRGRLGFDREGIRAKGIRARVLDTPVAIDIGPAPAGTEGTRIRARGAVASATLVKRFPDMGLGVLEGTADWLLSLDIPSPGAGPETPARLVAESDLAGVAVRLPAPLGKAAAAPRHFRLATEFGDGPARPVQIRFGDILDAALLLDLRDPRDMKLLRGELRLGGGGARLPPTDEMRLHAVLDELDLGPWLDRLEGAPLEAPSRPLSVDARIGVLRKGEFELREVALDLEQKAGVWSGRLASNLFAADVTTASLDRDLLDLRLQRLDLNFRPGGKTKKPGTERPPGREDLLDPRDFPALRLDAETLVLNEKDLGPLTLNVRRVDRGLMLEQTTIDSHQLSITASGHWLMVGQSPESSLIFDLKTSSMGDLLADLGFTRNIQGADATIGGRLKWPGGPQRASLASIEGQVSMRIGKGSFLEVEPGIGRVFGLLNITALQRRLMLDFSDLYGKGFSFDRIEGTFDLEKGDAYTNNLQIDGPAANILITGRTGLVKEDFDQQIIVSPQLTDSVILGTAIANPAVGAALFLFKNITGKNLDKITSYQYQVTGPWDNPVMSRKESLLLSTDQGDAPADAPDEP